MDLSYYNLLLTDYLRDSFPEKLDDPNFINDRASKAADHYCNLIKDSVHHDVASSEANSLLFEGLTGFSKYNFIKDAIRENFEQEVAEEIVPYLALLLLPDAEDVFKNYDDLEVEADKIGERKMYWEIIGLIDIYLKEHGLQ